MFDIPKHAQTAKYSDTKKEIKENTPSHEEPKTPDYKNMLQNALHALDGGNAENALSLLKQIPKFGLDSSSIFLYNYILLKVSWMQKDLSRLKNLDLSFLPMNPHAEEIRSIFKEMMASDNAMMRWWAYNFLMQDQNFTPEERISASSRALADTVPIIRYNALFVLKNHPSFLKEKLWDDIKRISREDPDPMVRDYAALIVKTNNE
jgi:hypothetical protein